MNKEAAEKKAKERIEKDLERAKKYLREKGIRPFFTRDEIERRKVWDEIKEWNPSSF